MNLFYIVIQVRVSFSNTTYKPNDFNIGVLLTVISATIATKNYKRHFGIEHAEKCEWLLRLPKFAI